MVPIDLASWNNNFLSAVANFSSMRWLKTQSLFLTDFKLTFFLKRDPCKMILNMQSYIYIHDIVMKDRC